MTQLYVVFGEAEDNDAEVYGVFDTEAKANKYADKLDPQQEQRIYVEPFTLNKGTR